MEAKNKIIMLMGIPESFVVTILVLILIIILAPYLPGKDFGILKIPQFTPPTRTKLKVIGPILLLALVMWFTPIIPWLVSMFSSKAKPGVVTILVADFDGPNSQNYRVTEEIIQRLRTETRDYSDISVQALGQSITEQQGSEVAREVGIKRGAGIVLWGYYGATSVTGYFNVHFEVLQKPELLSLNQNLETHTVAISELEGFKIQARLSGEMTYLTLLTVGLARFESKDYDGAISWFTTALAQSDVPNKMVDPADIYFYRAKASYYKDDANKIDSIIADLSKAIEFKPDFVAAYNNRGIAYDNKGDYDRAITDYDKAISLKPDYAIAYNNRGIAYDNKGEHDLAIADYTKYIEINHNDADAYYNRALVYKDKGERDHAVADLKQALQITSDRNLRQKVQQTLRELRAK